MHFEILIEDQSGAIMLDLLIPGIIGTDHTFRIHSYKGIGHLPKNLKSASDARKRILLDQLPRLLKGYGETYRDVTDYSIIVVCDLDDKCLKEFRDELLHLLDECNPRPSAHFCMMVEEGEAWFLGDKQAIRSAYPHAKEVVLNRYANDDICGTWEKLADAIVKGGSKKLLSLGWRSIGEEKSNWAEKITPHMDIETNQSPSFQYFRRKLRGLIS
jgi:hypothetical protein